jgi:spore maturation protein CgeB
MKNILYLLPTNKNQYLNFICDELRKYLTNIYYFNFVEYSYQNGIRNTEKHIKDFISGKKIDIVISSPFAGNYQLSVEFYASLKNKTKIVFWMWDDEAYFDSHSKYYCQTADAVITTDYYSVFAYKKLGVSAIFFSDTRSKTIYYPVEIVKDIDVCFLGDCKKSDRMEYINFLIKNGISVETFGVGSKSGFVNWNEFSKIFSRSKINLNFTKLDKLSWINKDEPLLNRVRQNKGRPIEITLTQSFCLSEYAPSLNVMFEAGKEIDVFYDEEELLEKVKYYLSSDCRREEIAQNAYKKAIENYESEICIPKTLETLENVLEIVAGPRVKKTEIFLSRTFKVNSINGLTFTMFVLIKNKKILHALELFRELFKYGVFIFFMGFYGGTVRAIKNMMMLLKTKISLKII